MNKSESSAVAEQIGLCKAEGEQAIALLWRALLGAEAMDDVNV